MTEPIRELSDIVCLACGCLCDDLIVRVSADKSIAIDRACQHGEAILRQVEEDRSPIAAVVRGQACTLEEGVAAAAEILGRAQFPVVYGPAELCVDGQRATCELADTIGGCLDSTESGSNAAEYFPSIGTASCTWGEVIQRADLIVYWNCDFDNDHWRHKERVLKRALARVNVKVVEIQLPGEGFSAIWRMRQHVQGRCHAREPDHEFAQLALEIAASTYIVFVHNQRGRIPLALQALAGDINASRRCRVIDLGRPGNAAGQEQVFRWQSGYGHSVGFHRGYPAHFGAEFSAEAVLRSGEADAIVTFGQSFMRLSQQAQEAVEGIPHINIAIGKRDILESAQVTLFTGMPGVDHGGTAFRGDSLTLPLRPVFSPSHPTAAAVIFRIIQAIRSGRG